MKKTIRIGKGLLPVLVLGLAVGALLSFGCGDEKIVTEYVEVEVVNNAPVLSEIGAKAVDLGGPLTFVVTASDPDGDALIFSALNLPPGATFDAVARTFSWTPEPGVTPAGTYEVTFIVSDGGKGDSEVVTIIVSAVAATGADKTGKYSVIAYNFPTGAGTCSHYSGGDTLCDLDIPAPGCEEKTPPLFAVQSDDDVIFYLQYAGQSLGLTEEGTGKNDGSFSVNTVVTADIDGPVTLSLTITGKVSADKAEGSMEAGVEWDGSGCDWGYDFIGPGYDNSNATITVNGFTQSVGVNVYAFVDLWNSEPTAIGGGMIGADGSAEIQLRPALPDGECFNVSVWLDIDGGGEGIMDCWENEGWFLCLDDLCALLTGGEFCIDEGGLENPIVLEPADFGDNCFP